MTEHTSFPRIDPVGLDGLLVRFGDQLNEAANRAALALRAALETAPLDGVEEVSMSLVSVFLRFDPLHVTPQDLQSRVAQMVAGRNWYDAPLPEGRRLHRIPTLYGTDRAPQLAEAAQAAGLTPDQAVADLSSARVRVLTIGFAPGQPYLGTLPEAWNIPRQTALTPLVPVGALVVAIRQLVLFSTSTPTGWRHVGQTAARLFRPAAAQPFLLRPGDEVEFPAVDAETFARMEADQTGGVTTEPVS